MSCAIAEVATIIWDDTVDIIAARIPVSTIAVKNEGSRFSAAVANKCSGSDKPGKRTCPHIPRVIAELYINVPQPKAIQVPCLIVLESFAAI